MRQGQPPGISPSARARRWCPPSTTREIVAGQGSVGLEIARQAPATRLVVVPLGGGGLASGVAIAIKSRLGEAKVIGVQAEACAPYLESLAARRPIGARSASTICDGIAVKRPGDLTLPLVERHLDGIVTVSDDEVAEAMVLLLERSKLVVEGAGAAGVAALLGGKVERPADGETARCLSGGNVDASRLAECIRLGETAAGRRIVLWTVVPDRPGALAALLRVVAEQGANVVDVEHIREGVEFMYGRRRSSSSCRRRSRAQQAGRRGRPRRGLPPPPLPPSPLPPPPPLPPFFPSICLRYFGRLYTPAGRPADLARRDQRPRRARALSAGTSAR